MDARITEHTGKWQVGSQTFDSRQAAELFLQSRDPKPGVTAFGAIKLLPWYVKVVAGLAVLGVMASLAPSKKQAANPIEQARVDRAWARTDSIALLINMNGELCGKITGIAYLHNNTYAVTCTRYRDGAGSATYEVDLDTGRAK